MSRSKLYGELFILLAVIISLGVVLAIYLDSSKEQEAAQLSKNQQRISQVQFASPKHRSVDAMSKEQIDNYVSPSEYSHFATCTVYNVTDGDKFFCRDTKTGEKLKISLFGISSPVQGQSYSSQAKNFLSKLILNKQVHYNQMFIDNYSRYASVIYVNHINVNLELLLHGNAHVDTRYNTQRIYYRAMDYAISNFIGLWNKHYWEYDRPPVKPWEFNSSYGSGPHDAQAVKCNIPIV